MLDCTTKVLSRLPVVVVNAHYYAYILWQYKRVDLSPFIPPLQGRELKLSTDGTMIKYLAHWKDSPQTDRHVAPLRYIILIANQTLFGLSHKCCMLSRKATNTNFIVVGLAQLGLYPMCYRKYDIYYIDFTPLFKVIKCLKKEIFFYCWVFNDILWHHGEIPVFASLKNLSVSQASMLYL